MSYARYKRDPEGLRKLVELLETAPAERRQRMIDAGNQEDKHYTAMAVRLMMAFEDIVSMPEMELAELIASSPPRVLGAALFRQPEDVRRRFLMNSPARIRGELKDYLTHEFALSEVGGARLKLVEIARSLEKRGLLQTKRIAA